METSGDRVRHARLAKGWTQERLAEAAGRRSDGRRFVYAGIVVSRWESADTKPHDADVIVSICDALGVSVDWLLRGIGKGPRLRAAS